MSDKLRDPIEDRWESPLWENNPELLEYTSSLERKLKIAEEELERISVEDSVYWCRTFAQGALSAIKEE